MCNSGRESGGATRLDGAYRQRSDFSSSSFLCLFVFFVAIPLRADDVIDAPMYRDPELPVPRLVEVFPEEAKALWLRALERPEVDLRIRAADSISLARRRGVKGIESTVPALVAALDRADQHPTVRVAVAKALIALGAKEAAPSLLRQAREGGRELRDAVEPTLAAWDHRPARELWLTRLREPATPPRDLVLAVRGLAAVGEERAAERLRELALSARVSGPLRLDAARALGSIRSDGLEKDAERLAEDASPRGTVARLVAASLLLRHRGEGATRLLQRMARDTEPAVAALAAARLVEIDPKLAVPAVEHLLASPDAKLRGIGVEILLRQPTERHLRLLGERLDDEHPDVRVQARRSLLELASGAAWRAQVIAEGVRELAADRWRGQEQATILLAQLDHKAAARRLLELLRSNRPEVFVASAWGLRKLAVVETLPGVVRYLEAEAGRLLSPRPPPDGEPVSLAMIDHQFSQLHQFVGRQKYAPADAVLRRFIPQRPVPESRAAAIWALGLIHEGKQVAGLAPLLEARLNATSTIPPEDSQVRYMSAITLGRLKAKEALPSLRTFAPHRAWTFHSITNACVWAIGQITGEAIPPPGTHRTRLGGWFLEPNR